MAHDEPSLSPQKRHTTLLWVKIDFLKQIISVRGRTSVFTEVRLFSYQTGFFQVFDCPFYSASGERQILCNGVKPRPCLVFRIHAVMQINIHQLCTVRQVGLIQLGVIWHKTTSLTCPYRFRNLFLLCCMIDFLRKGCLGQLDHRMTAWRWTHSRNMRLLFLRVSRSNTFDERFTADIMHMTGALVGDCI